MNTAFPAAAKTGSLKTSPHNNLHLYALGVAAATFLLVLAGGMVTSTGSSLAVPDWPLSNGQFFPKMEGGVFYEHGHRMIAGTVGLLTFILAGWLWRVRDDLKYLGLAAAGVVVLQAVLGGMTVIYRLPLPVSVTHACLGQIFFALICSIAYLTAFPPPGTTLTRRQPGEGEAKFRRIGVLTTTFVFLQLVAGATLRHSGKGLHLHLLGATLVAVHIPLLCRRLVQERRGDARFRLLAFTLPILVLIQAALGYFAWRTGPVVVTTIHVALGALLLAGSLIITLEAYRER
jgi:cytochrome c oxidase assembly protein subunit 15